MVMPRWRSSGALSIWSNADAWFRVGYLSASTLVIAAVRDVLPWSTWPIVPMLTCGLLRSNLLFAISALHYLFPDGMNFSFIGQLVFRSLLTGILCLDFLCDVVRD